MCERGWVWVVLWWFERKGGVRLVAEHRRRHFPETWGARVRWPGGRMEGMRMRVPVESGERGTSRDSRDSRRVDDLARDVLIQQEYELQIRVRGYCVRVVGDRAWRNLTQRCPRPDGKVLVRRRWLLLLLRRTRASRSVAAAPAPARRWRGGGRRLGVLLLLALAPPAPCGLARGGGLGLRHVLFSKGKGVRGRSAPERSQADTEVD